MTAKVIGQTLVLQVTYSGSRKGHVMKAKGNFVSKPLALGTPRNPTFQSEGKITSHLPNRLDPQLQR